ncbi:MAG: DUF554 domain-containing protein [Clostridiales bacterium]|nr:DUF554 domain-containing protein [Clostridiales bacterium]
MWAVFVNVFTVAVGSVAGLIARNLISKKLSDAIMLGIGACTVYIGISGALQGSNTLVLVLSMAIGGAVGTALDLDGKLGDLGGYLDRLVKKSGRLGSAQGDIVQAFVSASLLFCVGSMTIVGSLNAGLSQDYELLYTKSVMDLISSAMLSASLGIGVLFSALFVLVFQGGICMLAGVLAPFLGEYARGELICAGSVVIMLLGLNILGITKIKVADYLPALLIAPLLCLFM